MSQKRNKLIVLISTIAVIILVGIYLIFNYNTKVSPKIPLGSIHVIVTGPSYDAQYVPIGEIALANIKLSLADIYTLQVITSATTDNTGSCIFEKIPLDREYYIKVDNTSIPSSYYNSYQNKITFPYNQNIVDYYITLILNQKALRDLHRQQILYLYQDLLEKYKTENNHYPISKGVVKILDAQSPIILALKPYLISSKLGVDILLDPLKTTPILYYSNGTNYWLLAYSEIVTKVPMFNQENSAYYVHN